VTAIEAELYDLPSSPPMVFGAAVTASTAGSVGTWADGLLTVSAKPDRLKGVMEAFWEAAGEQKPIYVQVGLNWAPTEEEALRDAFDQWRFNVLGGDVNWDLRSPEEFETATRHVTPNNMRESLLISADLGQHAAWLADYKELRVSALFLHQVGRNQEAFIDAFGEKVIPQLR
jgi:alkanesulfonate monooxygenase SsuD/methylene tetrahydromethanopterin reductase-like flavin-dependent oxidoreductase (luciferase family)